MAAVARLSSVAEIERRLGELRAGPGADGDEQMRTNVMTHIAWALGGGGVGLRSSRRVGPRVDADEPLARDARVALAGDRGREAAEGDGNGRAGAFARGLAPLAPRAADLPRARAGGQARRGRDRR